MSPATMPSPRSATSMTDTTSTSRRTLTFPATMPSLASTPPSSPTLKLLFRKAGLASKAKSTASAVALNAEIHWTKARLLKEVPKLQRLGVKKEEFSSYYDDFIDKFENLHMSKPF
ncbi:hypothetical protein ABKV19_004772 [Rosa sericea]